MKHLLNAPEYAFLHDPRAIRGQLCYLTVAGSHAYGTAVPESDVDLRGVAVEPVTDLILSRQLNQYESTVTDTVVYGLRKYVGLCLNCNPNVVEMLGTRPEHVLVCTPAGQLLRDNVQLFLSKRAYATFTGYAVSQLRRLQNALARDEYQPAVKSAHIAASADNIVRGLTTEYAGLDGQFAFAVVDDQPVVTVHATNMPLKAFTDVNAQLGTLLRNYGKLNHRNRKKDDAHLRKHAMHLVRLYLTGIDILKGNGIHTYREGDHGLLMDIRNGRMGLDRVVAMADELGQAINDAYAHSPLPPKPDQQAVDNLLLRIYGER